MRITKPDQILPLPPGNLGLPLIGETLSVIRNLPRFSPERRQKYGDIFKTRIWGINFIYMYGVEATKFILTNENNYFVNSTFPNSKVLFGTNNLTWQRDEKHKNSRKILSQAFQNRALDGYIDSIQEITHKYLNKWADGEQIILRDELQNYSFDVICKILLGIDSGSQTDILSLLSTLSSGIFTVPCPLPQTKFGRALQSRKELFAQIEEIINRHKEHPELYSDALAILLQTRESAENNFTKEELKEQIIQLLFLGYKELTSALNSFCTLVSQHPGILEQIRAEQEQLSNLEKLNSEKLKQMVYLEQVFQEVLRLAPPVPGGIRKVIKECYFNGYRIPAAWNVVYRIDSIHLNSEIYPEPNEFNPERFNPERVEAQKKPYTYLPFGGGVRECLGKQLAFLVMKIYASMLIPNYNWEFLLSQDLTTQMSPVLSTENKLRVRFTSC